jgi:hypothetical protein
MPTADKTFWFWDGQLTDTFTRKEFGDPAGTRAADCFLFVSRDGDHSYYGDTTAAFYPTSSDAEPPVLAPRDYEDGFSGNYFGSTSELGWHYDNIITHPRFYGYLERGKTYKFHLKDSAGISKDRESWPGEDYNSERKKQSDLFFQTSGKSTYDSATQYTSGLNKDGAYATTTILIGGNIDNEAIIEITSTDGTKVQYKAVTSTPNVSDNEFSNAGSSSDRAESIKSAIENGHSGKITVSVLGETLTLTQSVIGDGGNKTINVSGNSGGGNITIGSGTPAPNATGVFSGGVTGVINKVNKGYTGTIVFTVPSDAPSVLYVRGNTYRDLALPREPKNSRGERISDGFSDYTYNTSWFTSNTERAYFQVKRLGSMTTEKTGYTSSLEPFSEMKRGYNKNIFGYDTSSGGPGVVRDGGGTFVVQISDTINRNYDISVLDPTSLDSGSSITPIGYYNPSTYNNQSPNTLRQFEIGKQVFETPSGMSSPPTDSPQAIGTQNITVYRGHTYVFHFTGGVNAPCGPSWMNGYSVTQGPFSARTHVISQFSFRTTGGSEYTTNMTYYSPPLDEINNGKHEDILDYIRSPNTDSNRAIVERYIKHHVGKGMYIPDDVYTDRSKFSDLMRDCMASSGTLVWHVPADESESQLKIHNRTDGSSDASDIINIADVPGGAGQGTYDNQNPDTNDLPFPEAFFVIKDSIGFDLDDSDYDGIPDSVEGTTLDSDSDGIKDYLDRDSDNDGIPDSAEGGGTVNQSSMVPTDTDSDGTPDYLESDSDDDGISDRKESETGDSDFDGTPDYQETDSDADNIPDSVEGNIDTDHDGFPNRIDTDSDNDGLLDIDEGTGDSDNDGVPDYLDNPDTDVGSNVIHKTIWLYDSQRTEDGLGSEKIRWAKDYRYKDAGYGKYKAFPHVFKYHVKDGNHNIEDAPNTPPLYPETHVNHIEAPAPEPLTGHSGGTLSENWGHDIPAYGANPLRHSNFMFYNQDALVSVGFSNNSIDIGMTNTSGGQTNGLGKSCYAFLWNKDFYYDPSETGPLTALDFSADIVVNNNSSSNHHNSLVFVPVVYVGQGENNATPTPDFCYLPGYSSSLSSYQYNLLDQWRYMWHSYGDDIGTPKEELSEQYGFMHAGAINTGTTEETTQKIHRYYGKKKLKTYTSTIPRSTERVLYGPGFLGSNGSPHTFWPLALGRLRWGDTYGKMEPSWDIGGRFYFGFLVAFINWKLATGYDFRDAKNINFSVKNFKVGVERQLKTADWQNIQRFSNYSSRDNRWLTANQYYPTIPTGLYKPEKGGEDV